MSKYFSYKNQAFYDITLNYPMLPDDLVAVTQEKYLSLLTSMGKGCGVTRDLVATAPCPSAYHKLAEDDTWVDNRSIAEKRQQYLQSLKPLTRRQFKLVLLESNLLDQVEMTINSIPDTGLRARTKIEYEDAVSFERLNPTLNQLYSLMGLKESQVDALWEDGLKL